MENTMVVCSDSGSNGGGDDTGRRHHRHHYQQRGIGARAHNSAGARSVLGDGTSAAAAPGLADDSASPQLFCLRWNNYQTNLTNVFDQLLQNESFVDVTLACADGHSVKAHKMVLSACSPYFQSLFYDNPCKHPIVIMKDIKWNELKAAIEFMYKGEINICQEQIGPLLKVAESLKIRGLADVNSEHELAAAAAAAASSSSSSSSASPVQRQSPALASVAVSAALAAAAAVTDPNAAPRRANLSDMISSANRKRRKLSLDPNGYAPAVADDDHDDDALNMMFHSPIAAAELMTRSNPVVAAAAAAAAAAATATTADVLCNPIPIANVAAATATCSSSATSSLIASYARTESSNSGCPLSQSSPARSPPSSNTLAAISQQQQQQQQQLLPPPQPPPLLQHAPSLSSLALPNTSVNVIDEMEIKPGIAEMIREEERAKMLESSQAWLNASSSSLTSDSYQYQLQSMWQKCWNTNQSLVQNLRFRERGPLKSWRPETMAEAILSVLKEGLSLSQAARKYDIPYPTFVLYANRVHNMLGPSIDGGSDLRPKGRGRPQRILLGYWPEDHIQNVIRAVVFRDPQHIKDEPLNLGYSRLSCFQEPLGIYGSNNSCLNSPEPPVSPNSTAAAAAVVAMAQGLRHQILAAAAAASSSAAAAAAAAAAHHTNNDNNNNFGVPFLPPQYANGSQRLLMTTASTNTITTAAAAATTPPLPSPTSTPPASPLSNENVEVGVAATGVPYTTADDNFPVKSESELLFHEEIEDLVIKSPPPLHQQQQQHPLPPSSLSPHLREATPSNEQQPKPLSVALEQRID